MLQPLEAVIDEQGNVHLLEPVRLPAARRALVIILEQETREGISETALLSEVARAEDWNRPEEDIYSLSDGKPFHDEPNSSS